MNTLDYYELDDDIDDDVFDKQNGYALSDDRGEGTLLVEAN